MNTLSASRIVFPKQKEVALESFSLPEPDDNEVLAKSVCSLVSTGTETTILNGAFDVGTHWHDWVTYPFFPGYSTVACVEAVGRHVNSVKVGDLIAVRGPHASHHVIAEDKAILIPAGVVPQEAVCFALAKMRTSAPGQRNTD